MNIQQTCDGNGLVGALLTEMKQHDPLAQQVIKTCIEDVKRQLLAKKYRGGPAPGVTNVFTGERLPFSWERKPPAGALDQLLFFATLVYALIVTNASPPNSVPLSQSGMLIDRDVLYELMHTIATSKDISIAAPFPYSQNEMKRSLEEHAMHRLFGR